MKIGNKGTGSIDLIAPKDKKTGKRTIKIETLPDDIVNIKKMIFKDHIKIDKKEERFSIKTSNEKTVFSLGKGIFRSGSSAYEAEFSCDLMVSNIIEKSSSSLKEKVSPLKGQKEKILRLNPVNFTWKENKKRDIGFIAEEVEKIYPSIVEGEEHKSIKYSKITSILTAGMKEMFQKLDEQEKEIEKLKEEIKTLKGL